MTSREKVLQGRQRLLSLQPEDEASAQMLQWLVAISPLLMRAIPDDPAELDGYLRTIAAAAAACRSDDAPRLGVFELAEGEWKPVAL